jgi:hypothetical protein
MAYIVCPECGAHNPPEAEECRVCQAELVGIEPVESPENPEVPEESNGEPFDLFSAEEKDLPDLLQGLKAEEDIEIDPEGLPDIDLDAEAEQDGSEEDQSDEDVDKTPEWLEQVRKRAHEEEDATGQMIQRISAAQETVTGGKDKSQHEDFESWLQKLRDEARDRVAGGEELPEAPEDEETDEDEEADEDWLTRIRKAHGTLEPQEGPDAAGRSLLDWLVALEEEHTGEKDTGPEPESDETQRVDLGETIQPEDDTRQVQVRTESSPKPAALILTREDRAQADLLATVVNDEVVDRPILPRRFKKGVRWVNVFFLVVLIAGLCVALFTGGTAAFAWPQAAPAARGLLDWTRSLREDASLLFIFDYQPAYAGEIELVAKPVLGKILDRADSLTLASSSASGSLLADSLLADYSAKNVTDIGYFPIESFGAYGLATGLTDAPSSSSSLPSAGTALLSGSYDGIVILSDTFESAQSWVEQLSARAPETALALMVTKQAAPLLEPYFDSGQIVGLAGGLQDGVTLSLLTEQTDLIDHRWRAYQVGIFVLVGALVLGAVFSTPQGSDSDMGGTP